MILTPPTRNRELHEQFSMIKWRQKLRPTLVLQRDQPTSFNFTHYIATDCSLFSYIHECLRSHSGCAIYWVAHKNCHPTSL